jgi:hypothetical protein
MIERVSNFCPWDMAIQTQELQEFLVYAHSRWFGFQGLA